MYFTRGMGGVYHILAHPNSGSAPAPCGVKANKYELVLYHAGRPTSHIVAEKPANSPLCKHCEASTRKPEGAGTI